MPNVGVIQIVNAPREVHHALPLGVGAVSEARHFVQGSLRGWGVDADTIASTTLIVSELVTNAVLYGHGASALMLCLDGGELQIEVGDGTSAEPTRRSPSDDSEVGRGLHIIDAVALSWGVRPTSEGKVVWARLACPADPATLTAAVDGTEHKGGLTASDPATATERTARPDDHGTR